MISNIFSCACLPSVCLFWWNVHVYLCVHFLIGFFIFLMLSFESTLHSLDMNPLLDMWFTDIFFQIVNCFFKICKTKETKKKKDMVFCRAQILYFDEDNSHIFMIDLKNFELPNYLLLLLLLSSDLVTLKMNKIIQYSVFKNSGMSVCLALF